MDSKSEIAMLEILHSNAEERASTWETLANSHECHTKTLKKNVWDIMGKAVIRENRFGDATEVVININDWRELCELVNFGV